MAGNLKLRTRLQQITDTAAADGVTPDELETMLIELSSECPHTIRRLTDESRGHNCFAYAFDLVDSPEYEIIALLSVNHIKNVFYANLYFAQYLINNIMLEETETSETITDNLILYFNHGDEPTHAGKVLPAKNWIKSKWGGGLFLEHGIWEVPLSYGNNKKFCRAISKEVSLPAFKHFAKSQDSFPEFYKEYENDLKYINWD